MFRKPLWLMIPLLGLIIVLVSFRHNNDAEGQDAKTIKAQLIATFPHDPNDFCQGLIVEGDTVYEGTGRYGQSAVKKYDLTSGKVSQQVGLHQNYFGEGIAIIKDRIYQLTWKERVCVVYDKETFKAIGQFSYTGEGWGLTTDGKYLYMSIGTAVIHVIDPDNFKTIRKIRVAPLRRPADRLNELEFVGDELWACIWYEDKIARIDPQTGKIKGYFDCSSLYPKKQRPDKENVLNGIAYDPKAQRLFISGKLWPTIYEVELPKDLTGREPPSGK